MDKEKLIEHIEKGMTLKEIAQIYTKSKSSIRHWLKKYDLKTINPQHTRIKERCCSKCKDTDENNFYGNDKYLCAKCSNKRNVDKIRKTKKYVIESLGGKCASCGFDKYPCSLDVHHTNPKLKDKNFKSWRNWNIERVKKEILTCILLCRNCHAAVHSGLLKI